MANISQKRDSATLSRNTKAPPRCDKTDLTATLCHTTAGRPLDTLGQLPTRSAATLLKKARRKWWTNHIAGHLCYLESPLHKMYQRAYYCAHVLTQQGQKITSKYCKSRVCHVCNAVRAAELMRGYVSQLGKLGSLEFVTLTAPTVSRTELATEVTQRLKAFSNIIEAYRTKMKRAGTLELAPNGIRKIEISYNPQQDRYHPHLHVLIDKGAGEWLIGEWLSRFPKAVRSAQHTTEVQRLDDGSIDPKALNEVFKYSTKIVHTTKQRKGKKGAELDPDERGVKLYLGPLDTIFQALHKRRTVQPFGNALKMIDEDNIVVEAQEYDHLEPADLIEWIWNDGGSDWVANGRELTGYRAPDPGLIKIYSG